MKMIYILLSALIFSFTASAQLIDSPADVNPDTVEFANIYGSVKEYNMQTVASFEGRPVMIVGAKCTYIKELCFFFTDLGYGRTIELDEGDGWMSFKVPISGFVESGQPQHVTFKATTDKDLRTTKLTITGRPDDMIKLFLGYWHSDISLNQLKKGGYIYQDAFTDRVAFSWKGTNPVITVTKNPHISFDLTAK